MPSGIYIRTEKYRLETSLRMKGKKSFMSEEAREKARQRMLGNKIFSPKKGEEHHLWIKDRTQLKETREKAYDTKYKYWMREVKKRDNWKCKINNEDCEGRLEAHHILDWNNFSKLRYDINNGITLCHAHHPRGRENEAKLSPYLQSLVVKI